MRKYIVVLSIVMLTASVVFAKEAPKDMTKFNDLCPAEELCPLLDVSFKSCKSSEKEQVCSIYVEIFKNLVDVYDCQRPFDNTDDKKFIVPAVWLCDETKLWGYIELLSKLRFNDAQEFFASSEFRSILDGMYSEGFMDLSLEREKSLRNK